MQCAKATTATTSREGYALTWDVPNGSPTCLLRSPNDPAFPQFRPRNNNSGDLMSALRAGKGQAPKL